MEEIQNQIFCVCIPQFLWFCFPYFLMRFSLHEILCHFPLSALMQKPKPVGASLLFGTNKTAQIAPSLGSSFFFQPLERISPCCLLQKVWSFKTAHARRKRTFEFTEDCSISKILSFKTSCSIFSEKNQQV